MERDGYEIKTQPRTQPENVRERVVRERGYHNLHLVEEHVGEFEYAPGACKKSYRVVAVRKLVTHEQGNKLLFPEIRYFFYITNKRAISAREIVRLANTRCDEERLIGQLKSGVKSLRNPVDDLFSNWAYLVIATLAWNLAKWFALLLPESGRWKDKHADEKNTVLRMNFRTFVSAFMIVPAQVVATGRRVILRFARLESMAAPVLPCSRFHPCDLLRSRPEAGVRMPRSARATKRKRSRKPPTSSSTFKVTIQVGQGGRFVRAGGENYSPGFACLRPSSSSSSRSWWTGLGRGVSGVA